MTGLDDGGRLLPLGLRRQARAALDDMERQPAARGVLASGSSCPYRHGPVPVAAKARSTAVPAGLRPLGQMAALTAKPCHRPPPHSKSISTALKACISYMHLGII